MIFAQEILTEDLKVELMPLFAGHCDEISVFPEAELCPDWESYDGMQNYLRLKIYTARENGELAGYAFYIVMPHLHYSKSLFAFQDLLYLKPEYRGDGNGVGLIKYSEKKLKKLGVDRITQHSKEKKDLTGLLTRLGYELCDIIFTKRL